MIKSDRSPKFRFISENHSSPVYEPISTHSLVLYFEGRKQNAETFLGDPDKKQISVEQFTRRDEFREQCAKTVGR